MFTKNKIGILGGSFNPVHTGHLVMAQDAIDLFELSRVIFVPSARPPHKKHSHVIDHRHRMAMLELALDSNLMFSISDAEIKRDGISFTVDTLTQFKAEFPEEAELCFIIGADTLPELHGWKDIYKILSLCTIVSISRPGFTRETIKPESLKLDSPWPERLLENLATGHSMDISSSDIRYRIAEGMPVNYLVPDSVAMYMAEHNLYRTLS